MSHEPSKQSTVVFLYEGILLQEKWDGFYSPSRQPPGTGELGGGLGLSGI